MYRRFGVRVCDRCVAVCWRMTLYVSGRYANTIVVLACPKNLAPSHACHLGTQYNLTLLRRQLRRNQILLTAMTT